MKQFLHSRDWTQTKTNTSQISLKSWWTSCTLSGTRISMKSFPCLVISNLKMTTKRGKVWYETKWSTTTMGSSSVPSKLGGRPCRGLKSWQNKISTWRRLPKILKMCWRKSTVLKIPWKNLGLEYPHTTNSWSCSSACSFSSVSSISLFCRPSLALSTSLTLTVAILCSLVLQTWGILRPSAQLPLWYKETANLWSARPERYPSLSTGEWPLTLKTRWCAKGNLTTSATTCSTTQQWTPFSTESVWTTPSALYLTWISS